MRIVFLYLISLIWMLLPNISFAAADTFCKILENEIKKNQIDLRLDLQPETYTWGADYGIDLDFDSNFKYIRNNDGSIRVFNVRKKNSIYEDFQSYELIHPNANIISVNGEKVSELSDAEIDTYFYPDIDENINSTEDLNKNLTLELEINSNLEDDTKTIKVDPLYNIENWIYPEVNIHNFRYIDSKKGIYNLNLTLYYYWQIPELISLVERLLKNNNITEDQSDIAYCQIKPDTFESLQIWHPSLDFKNIIEESIDEARYDYIFEYYPPDEEEEASAYISYQWDGNTTLSSNFNFLAFPFDTQILSLDLMNMRDDTPIGYNWLKYSFIESNFEKNLKIPDWQVVSKEIVPRVEMSDYHREERQIYSLQMRIERNYSYYVYKIIIPIMIILTVAWSALWVAPRYLESRLTITIICLLSLIAYNFIVDKDLPKLEYLTLLDYWILLAYLFAAVPTIISVISFRMLSSTSEEKLRNFDKSVRFYGPILFFILVIGIFLTLASNNDNTALFIRNTAFLNLF